MEIKEPVHIRYNYDDSTQQEPGLLAASRIGARVGALPLPLQSRSHQQRPSVKPPKIRFLKRSKYFHAS
jgi:hypothetical protein